MSLEVVDYYRDTKSLYDECRKCMSYHSVIIMSDGSMLDGIIEDVDDENVSILVGENVMENDDDDDDAYRQRPFGRRRPGGYRRFRRRRFPMRNIRRVGVLRYPFIIPIYPTYPYPYPFYPF